MNSFFLFVRNELLNTLFMPWEKEFLISFKEALWWGLFHGNMIVGLQEESLEKAELSIHHLICSSPLSHPGWYWVHDSLVQLHV